MRRWLSIAAVVGIAVCCVPKIPASAVPGPGTHETFNCALRSRANGLFVSAELGDNSYLRDMLRERATTIGLWESFVCDAIGTSSWAIQSRANGHFVSAELGYPGVVYGMLRARANPPGPWEEYTFVLVGSCSCYAIRAANGLYVSAELGDTGLLAGMLRARASVIGPWEEFDVIHGPRPTVTAIDDPTASRRDVVFPGVQVTISGTGFAIAPGATSFDFGTNNPAPDVTCSSTTQCVATVPRQSGPTNPVDVIATVNGLASHPNPPWDQALWFVRVCPPCPGL
jgi:hypothetical protein